MSLFGRRTRSTSGIEETTLAGVRAGDLVEIAHIADDSARAQALRFGMGAGAAVTCTSTIAGGPIMLRSGRQEIAVGRGLANRISVRTVGSVADECA